MVGSQISFKHKLWRKRQDRFKREQEERELLIIILLGTAIACFLVWPIAQFVAHSYNDAERNPLVIYPEIETVNGK